MSKIIGALLLVALAVRLVVLFFFKRNIVLNEISLVLFIAVFVVAVIVMLAKWWKWRTKLFIPSCCRTILLSRKLTILDLQP